MNYVRMPIEIESPEQMGYENVRYNLTESSFSDAQLGDLDLDLRSLLLCYGDHQGNRRLRELIAEDSGVSPDEVLITAGAAAALFVIATSVLRQGDRLLVERPNYATNIETPRAIGAELDFLQLHFEEGFRPNLDRLAALIQPQTKLVSITVPHNPTGSVVSETELRQIIALCESRGVTLLVDETYREMAHDGPLPVAASLSPQVLSVSSLSKTWGLPGIRIGWLICRDRPLMPG
jgi:aspartate/methionine/tyrosine aminotransferase